MSQSDVPGAPPDQRGHQGDPGEVGVQCGVREGGRRRQEGYYNMEGTPSFWHCNKDAYRNPFAAFVQESSAKDEKKIKQEIGAVIRQITASVTFLPLLDCLCSFDILIYTHKLVYKLKYHWLYMYVVQGLQYSNLLFAPGTWRFPTPLARAMPGSLRTRRKSGSSPSPREFTSENGTPQNQCCCVFHNMPLVHCTKNFSGWRLRSATSQICEKRRMRPFVGHSCNNDDAVRM